MCRFVTYLGKKPIILSDLIESPEHSLINQSRRAREGKLSLNADGFGIGWYDHTIDGEPGLFKSMQPAWNDQNLKHISAKIRSTCFIGHVRSSTVGDLSLNNCHPFSYQEFLFAHNGTIREFHAIKRSLVNQLSETMYHHINGQTDSEYFFTLLMHYVFQRERPYPLSFLADCIQKAIHTIQKLQDTLPIKSGCRLNTVLTNGKELLVTRYVSDQGEPPLSLYAKTLEDGIIIASEALTSDWTVWQEVKPNTLLLVDQSYSLTEQKLA